MSDVGEWFAPLPLVVDPAEEAARMRTGDWRQDAEYPVPLWTATAAELASRISIELVAGLVALHLPTRYDADVDRVFRYIDYPAFDNGSLDVGFAILVHGAELHVLSRVVHFHK